MDFDFQEEEGTETAITPLGGYDYLFLEEPPSDVICPICCLVAREPQQVSCCGKIYCLSCFTELEAQSKWRLRCANCREEEPESFPDRKTAGQINSLRIACLKREDGCTWRGALRELEKHFSRCEYSNMICPFNTFGCRCRPLRKDLEDHEDTNVRQHLKLAVKHIEQLESLIQNKEQDHCEQLSQLDTSVTELKGIQQTQKKELKKQIDRRLDSHTDTLKTKMNSIKSDIITHTRELPLVFKLDCFSELQDDDEDWHSPTFFTQQGGYRMCLRVYTNGCSEVRGTHLSLYVYLMRSEHDQSLEWPFRGTVYVEILNHLEDGHHYQEKITFNSRETKNYNTRVKSTSNMGVTGLGKSRFISLVELEQHERSNTSCRYLREDAIYFRISKVEVHSVNSRPWLTHVEDV